MVLLLPANVPHLAVHVCQHLAHCVFLLAGTGARRLYRMLLRILPQSCTCVVRFLDRPGHVEDEHRATHLDGSALARFYLKLVLEQDERSKLGKVVF